MPMSSTKNFSRLFRNSRLPRNGTRAAKEDSPLKILIGLVLSFMIGAGCRYFDIPAASPLVIPGALIVLAMTLGYTSMDRLPVNKNPKAETTKHLFGGPSGLPATESARTVR